MLGEYKNCDTPIKLRHNSCGLEWNTTTPYSFTRKTKPTRCPKCAMENKKNNASMNEETFLEKITDINKKKFKIIGKYTKGENPIQIQCKNCESIFETKANLLNNKNKRVICPTCEKPHPRKDTDWFKNKVKTLVRDEYEVLGEYIGSEDKILMKHNICGYEWDTTIPTSFLRGTRCPYCKSSKAEKVVFNYLTRNNIEFESQKTFDDLKGYKKFLPYDFYIIEKIY